MTDLRTGSVRAALGDLLVAEWDATNTDGYGPKQTGDQKLNLHLGQYDEDTGHPQLVLNDVSAELQKTAWDGVGGGTNRHYDGRIDIQIFVGGAGDLEESANRAQLLAQLLAHEARDIVHAFDATGLDDSSVDATVGEAIVGTTAVGDQAGRLVQALEPLSMPFVLADDSYETARYYATVEVGYRRIESPPTR